MLRQDKTINTLEINNSIDLQGDINPLDKGKGRKFISRFIEPGVAEYKESFGKILITKETLDKFIQTIIGCPVIIKHKDITAENVDKERVGVVSDVYYNAEDGWYYCSGVIFDSQAIDLIENHGWSVSCTYDFDTDNKPGKYHGMDYDMEFINGEFAHLAVVPNPRYERANIVMNSNEIQNDNPYHEPAGTERGGQFAKSKISEFYKKENTNLTDEEHIAKLKDIKANIEKSKTIIKENKISEEDKNLLLEGIERDKEYFNFHKENLSLFKKSPDEIMDVLFELAEKADKNLTDEDKLLLEILKDQQEVNNIGDITMTVLNELKDFIKSVVNNEKDKEMDEVKNEDKRKLIDEVGGILKGKVDDEIIRTIMKKMEEASYEPSEKDKADNEEDEEKFEEEKEIADNKKAKNEEKDKDDEVDKKEIENKCKNSMDDVKKIIMGGSTKVKSNYISKDERFALGEQY